MENGANAFNTQVCITIVHLVISVNSHFLFLISKQSCICAVPLIVRIKNSVYSNQLISNEDNSDLVLHCFLMGIHLFHKRV